MINIERLGWILNVFLIHPYCVGMVWGGRFRPLFLFKYRRVAKMINIERLGWILNVFFKSTLTVLVGRFRPLFLFKYRRVAKMINIERLGWISNVFFKSTPTVLVWCGVVGFDPSFCSNIAGWLK